MSAKEPIRKKSEVVSLADEDGVRQILANSVLGLWEVVNNLKQRTHIAGEIDWVRRGGHEG